MSTYPYTVDIKDAGLLIDQRDCELVAGCVLDAGVPVVTITAVYVEAYRDNEAVRFDLLTSNHSALQALGHLFIDIAESDDDFTAMVTADHGFVYRGLGANDPDGHFVRRVAA